MNPNEFRIALLAIVAVALVALSPVACTMHRQRTIAAAVDSGADPIAMRCALEGDAGTNPMCVIAASKGRQ